MKCYRCGNELTRINKSIEHIFPNGIGGKLKSSKLLCKVCNSEFGSEMDAELCKQFNVIASMLMIDREKGKMPNIKNAKTKSGERYNLIDGIYPQPIAPKIVIDEEKNSVYISAKDEKELKHIIKQLKKKYPNLDDRELENRFQKSKQYMDETLHLNSNLGGNIFLKAVVKIAISYYLYKTQIISDVKEIIEEIKSEKEISNKIVHFYFPENWQTQYSETEVSHTILIKSNREKKLLYAFIDLFSTASFIVNLTTNYNGPDVSFCYCYDLVNKKSIEKNIDVSYNGSLEGDLNLLNQRFISIVEQKFNRAMAIADQRQIDFVIKKMIDEASKRTLKKNPEGTPLTEQMMKEFFNEVVKDAAPFIFHIKNKRNIL